MTTGSERLSHFPARADADMDARLRRAGTEAESLAREAQALRGKGPHKNDTLVQRALGRALMAQRRDTEAQAQFNLALATRPSWPALHVDVGNMFLTARMYDDARARLPPPPTHMRARARLCFVRAREVRGGHLHAFIGVSVPRGR